MSLFPFSFLTSPLINNVLTREQSLAYLEMRLILSKLLYNFDIHICKESENWIDQDVYTIWNKPALMVELEDRMA